MINFHDIQLAFGEQSIFDNLSFNFNSDQHIGLVGRNGSGKSTLLRVIAGKQQLDGGRIALAKNKTLAYLPQEVVLQSDKTILAETLMAFEQMMKLQQEQQELEQKLESGDHDIIERYSDVCMQLTDFNVEEKEAEVKKVLMGLGFSEQQLETPVNTLSGGWKMRVVLAKILLQKADFYLFDEPTNHLDIVAQEWFLHFLKNADFGFMIVCHDRYYLDQVCDYILELERGNGRLFVGNYSKYEKEKAAALELLQSQHTLQQKERTRKMRTVDRFKASASKAKMAQSMLKKLEKEELIELPPQPKDIHFTFPEPKRAGREVVKVNNVAQHFGDKEIFKNVSFLIERGQRVAIVAPNGVGKTTLFNLIIDKLSLQQGSIELGHNVDPVIFDQDQMASLQMNKTVLENIQNACSQVTEQKVRTFAGSFLFGNDDIQKKAQVLSGGERNRVGMIKVLLQNANLLLLDEPTNHLDIPSKDILLNALNAYKGTMLFVSHDHDFVQRLATHIIELRKDGVDMYEGNYESYLYQKEERIKQLGIQKSADAKTMAGRQQKVKKEINSKQEYELNKESKKLERKIEKLEQAIKHQQMKFADLEYGSDAFVQADHQLRELKKEHKQIMSEWEYILGQL
jgi:ATP-binding cassette, subfamily F, member 3